MTKMKLRRRRMMIGTAVNCQRTCRSAPNSHFQSLFSRLRASPPTALMSSVSSSMCRRCLSHNHAFGLIHALRKCYSAVTAIVVYMLQWRVFHRHRVYMTLSLLSWHINMHTWAHLRTPGHVKHSHAAEIWLIAAYLHISYLQKDEIPSAK